MHFAYSIYVVKISSSLDKYLQDDKDAYLSIVNFKNDTMKV